MKIIIFEDGGESKLLPLCFFRPSCDLMIGGYSLLDWAKENATSIEFLLRPELKPVYPELQCRSADYRGILWLNSRLLPDLSVLDQVLESCGDQSFKVVRGGQLLLSYSSNVKNLSTDFHSVLESNLDSRDLELDLFASVEKILDYSEALIAKQIEAKSEQYLEIKPGVYAQGPVEIHPTACLDSTEGPILIEQGVKIDAFAMIKGPSILREGSKVVERGSLHSVALGRRSKAGGEVEATVIDQYSNKQHFGFLGHAWVGSWVNLGAGTSNSDLKNTYGKINIKSPWGDFKTGRQFFGALISDYVKTAIHTSIYTGKLIGPSSHLYGTITASVPSFVNFAPSLNTVNVFDLEAALRTQDRMFKRRDKKTSAADQQLMRSVFDQTKKERSGLPSGVLSF